MSDMEWDIDIWNDILFYHYYSAWKSYQQETQRRFYLIFQFGADQ